MAEAIGVAASAVTLAALFSSCVECFSYFKAAQNCPIEAESLLVKLDCEKARLLVWGNTVGILQTDPRQRHPELANVAQDELLRRCINQIIILLTDAVKLQAEYGGRVTDDQESQRYLAVLSVNGMNVFQSARRTFFARVGARNAAPSLLSRIKWAVRDAAKFRILLLNLKDFVDHLIQLVPVSPETISNVVEEDIISTVDIGSLRLIENACDQDNYPQWSARATEVIRESEIGTVDRRNLMEILNDTDALEDARGTSSRSNIVPQGAYSNLAPSETYIVLTDKCLNLEAASNSFCTDSKIGTAVTGDYHQFSFASLSSGTWNLGRRLCEYLTISWRCKVYVYCGLCACAINTARTLAQGKGMHRDVEFVIRIDDRLSTSCRESGSVISGLDAIRTAIHDCEATNSNLDTSLEAIDCPALEKRIHALEQELHEQDEPETMLQKFLSEEHPEAQGDKFPFAGCIIIAENDIYNESFEHAPFHSQPRRVRAGEMYKFEPAKNGGTVAYDRRFLGRFNKSKLWEDTEKSRNVKFEVPDGEALSISQPGLGISPRKRPRSDFIGS